MLENEQVLKKAFDFYDEDKNGFITFEELRKVTSSYCSDDQLREMIKEVDLNDDSKIAFDEFVKMMEHVKLSTSKFRSAWSMG